MRLIEVFCQDAGRAEKLSVFLTETGYRYQTQPELEEGRVHSGAVQELLAALSVPVVSEEDAQHDRTCRVTGPLPTLLARFTDVSSRRSWLRASGDAIHMLPLQKLEGPGQKAAKTYDQNLSLALANVLPEGFTNRDILSGERSRRERDLASKPTASALRPAVAFEDVLARAREQGRDPAWRLLLPIDNVEVAALLSQGAPPDAARDGFGQTALMQAVSRSDGERVALLLHAGADPNAVSTRGDTPLHLAGHPDVAIKLIEAGANIDHPGHNGATPLMMAAYRKNRELVELLLMSGANLETVDNHGQTALLFAVERTDAEMVQLLLRFGTKKEAAVARAQYAVRRANLNKEMHEAALELISEEDRLRLHAETVQILGEKLSAELDQEFGDDIILARCLEVVRILA